MYTKKKGQSFYRLEEVVADLLFSFNKWAHHACQHVQYGNENYMNTRCQPWA